MKNFKMFWLISLIFVIPLSLSADNKDVAGKISDQNGNSLSGTNICIKDTKICVTSDIDGKYTIKANQGDTLVFSHIGMITREIVVASHVIDVVLSENKKQKVVLTDLCESYGFTGGHPAVEFSGSTTLRSSWRPLQSEQYATYKDNSFVSVEKDPLSTFSLDVDGASYSNVRRMINSGKMPEKDAVRLEEFVNYFSYHYRQPQGKDPIGIDYEMAPCPWNKKHKLVRIVMKAKEIPTSKIPESNLVFLIDVSGSMYSGLELVKSSLKLLVNNLRDSDRIAIVTYAGSAGEVLPSTPGSDKQKIREALDNLKAGGSTAGGVGIQLAYKIARNNFIKGGNNRIILATDGDFNVGVSSAEGLEKLIEGERKSGVFLTVLGFGMGNYKDNKVQVLAEKGNGNFAYIDNLQEANKVLVNEFGSTMYTVAKDVKLQVEFNPEKVHAFRLLGYESRMLEHEDFNNDLKDAGDLGAGHHVTAFYEIVPAGVESNVVDSIDPLKYQKTKKKEKEIKSGFPDLMTIKLRYKDPEGDISKKIEKIVIDKNITPSKDFWFSASVAMFAQLLKGSEYIGEITYDDVLEYAKKGIDNDKYGYKGEFIRLVECVRLF